VIRVSMAGGSGRTELPDPGKMPAFAAGKLCRYRQVSLPF